MTGLDTNILVQYALATHPSFAATSTALNNEIKAGNVLAVAPAVILEFLHVVTDNKRLSDALTMHEALDWVDRFLAATNVQVVAPSKTSLQQTLLWLKQHQLGRKRLLDTDLIATYQNAGCTRLLTSNPGDFAIFNALQLIVP